ncbi:GTP cyclohydrolase [Aeromonas salmonicida subsp. salmonicida]|uniref:GTP cyclohydrolase-2 n=2 Tax=Aeromonas salmonicida subsp. salmonicida TaxID=29491 RepID=A4SLS3_AERS4|nr:GTP cyclohydrolase II [Aeromonas salmonicida]ABO89845.1 GTP cyclohydrolase II [Aeromonas salmonicida subsp. salmonicida A449]ASI23162.1 GTP cyclohydrolase II [Aeromonas salmonicida]ASI27476.1 GTP cyclohydrolase II [Aeromonas salmonicida]ASI31597.1 GTP cyclohydrolase II [Aeromonas salmonicida]AYO62910.1 GTP cyclohydrolase II [Aeromonas salmonicida subsp. salmonicida 01-B526]
MSSVTLVAKSKLPTPWGTFTLVGFQEAGTGKDHAALVMGDVKGDEPVLGRIHSECLTGDALFSLRCDCGFQLQAAMENITKAGRGVLLYVRQEGRGIGLLNKIRAYHLQDQGADTVEANVALGFAADMRDYTICADMLKALNVTSLRLMTNNPRKMKAMESFGIPVTERVPLQEGRNPHNEFYLSTKANKLDHMFKK